MIYSAKELYSVVDGVAGECETGWGRLLSVAIGWNRPEAVNHDRLKPQPKLLVICVYKIKGNTYEAGGAAFDNIFDCSSPPSDLLCPDPSPGNLSEVPERHHQPDRRKLLLPAEQIIDI